MAWYEERTDRDALMYDKEEAACGPKESSSKTSMVHHPGAVFDSIGRSEVKIIWV
jgi:hypothetical protein